MIMVCIYIAHFLCGYTQMRFTLYQTAIFSPLTRGPFLNKVRSRKTKKILRFETLHKCKLCLNAKPVDIKSSVHKRPLWFLKWLFAPEKFSGFLRNGPQGLGTQRAFCDALENWVLPMAGIPGIHTSKQTAKILVLFLEFLVFLIRIIHKSH